jgi:hypothetical protein
MTPIEFVIFEGDSTPNQPVYQIAEAMQKTIRIFGGSKEWEVLSYYWHEGHMTLDIQEKNNGTTP